MRSIKPAGVIGAAILLVLLFLCLAGPPALASRDSASSAVGTWHLVKTDLAEEASLTQVQIIDPNLIYALVYEPYFSRMALYCSTDGGFHWVLKRRQLASNSGIQSFFFLDEMHGWVVDYSRAEGDWHDDPFYVLRTTDGGENWARVGRVGDFGGMFIRDIVFFDQSTGFLIGANSFSTYIWKTEDGGLTWVLVVNDDVERYIGATKLVRFVDQGHGWLLANWLPEKRGPEDGLFCTTDGGLTWTLLPGYEALMPSPFADLSDLDFVDVNTGWAVGGEGAILRTDDAGLTWKRQSAPTTKRLCAVDFLDPLTGWVVGEGGTILHTRDGGQHWEDASPVGFSSSLTWVQCLDESHGWALGYDGELLRYGWVDSEEFVDVSEYRSDIFTLAREGIVQGYDDGSFRPDNPVLRAQLAKMLVGALRIPVSDGAVPCPFADVPRGPAHDPLYPDDFVAVAAANGIVQGFTATSFGPYQPVTRIQMVSMVVRALERLRPGRLEQPPADWPHWPADWGETADPTHGKNVRLAEYNGLLCNWDPREFDLYETATRGEMAEILYAALGGEFAPLWPLKVSKTTLAELAQELKTRFRSQLPIYLPRELPDGWGIAESPLPANPWLWEPGVVNPLIEDQVDFDYYYCPYYIVFTDGSTMVELLWPVVGDYGLTATFLDDVTYFVGDVHMDLVLHKVETPGAVPCVHLRSQVWALDAIRAIAGALEEVRR